ncbi:hypothetical protein [Actinopolymorpha sp. B9G3]|uniref:hypothetical protein n=1 Tax=Actinopolymorpha sp. B9G3 TaxID=3158970 RepID=UPI0032D8BCAB
MPHRSGHRELFEGFAAPQAAFSPAPIWWWSGERVELDRLRWQLDQLVEAGVHNMVVLNLAPTGPTYGSLADDPPLLSEEWWALWEGLCEYAGKRGVLLWFYDQIGFSGANLQGRLVTAHPEYAGASLERVVQDVDGPVELVCPAAGSPISACALPLSADGPEAAGTVSGPPIPLEVVDGRVRWDGAEPGRHRVMLAYALRQGFDYTSADACAALLDIVHGAFERRLGPYLGTVIVGSFQDELPNLPSWGPAYADEFARRRGYRMEDTIAALWEAAPSLPGGLDPARVRADYQRVRATLAEEAFFQPLHAWHERHGLTVGVDQQSPARAGEPLGSTRQYADYMRTHRWFSAPGSDHHGEAKIHSSLAQHYGRPRTWIESFHSSGWGGTLEETFDWLVPWLLAGANLYNPHAVYYSTRGGWWEWAPPSTCWRQPYWRHYKHFADTVSRLCWLLTRGEHVCDVGVLYPSATVQSATLVAGVLPDATRAQETYNAIVGRMVWHDPARGVLHRDDRDFVVLDDDTVAGARVADRALHTRAASYRAVVLPSCRFLESATAKVLADFCADGGLLVVVGDPPEHADTDDGEEAVRRLRLMLATGLATGAVVQVASPEALPAALNRLERPVALDGPTLRRRVGELEILLVPAEPTGWATRFSGGRDWIRGLWRKGYDFDSDRRRDAVVLRLDPAADDIEQWDPVSGTSRPADARRLGDGAVEVTVRFDEAPAAVLVWRRVPEDTVVAGDACAGGRSAAGGAASELAEVPLGGAWSASLVRTLDNRYGDLALPASSDPFPLQQWRLRHQPEPPAAGTPPLAAAAASPSTLASASTLAADDWARPDLDDSGWSDVLVGQGTFAWRTAPLAADAVPPPLPAGHDGPLDAPFDGSGWTPVRYSLSRGIEKDPFQAMMLGPKARVPDDFWHVAGVKAGQVVAFRTSLPVKRSGTVTLAVEANGAKDVWWNGEPLGPDPGGFLRLDQVRARAGNNLLEVRVTADVKCDLRGYWALTTDPDAFARPAWLVPEDGTVRGTELVARGVLTLPATRLQRAVLQLGTEGPARLVLAGKEIATQGAFEPYGGQDRVLPYDVTEHLVPGDNPIEVHFTDIGRPLAVFADAVIEFADATTSTFVTDASSWTFTRDGLPVGTALRRLQPYDPRFAWLRPRPHPLPRASWLEPAVADGSVLDLVPEARPGAPKPAEWFRLVVPPGATSATMPVASARVQAWLDGVEIPVTQGRVALPGPDVEGLALAVRIEPIDGRSGGALWDGPVEFECGDGPLSAGPWADAGLGSYSGGVRYRRQVHLDGVPGSAVLDLGAVRGTAEVVVNGQPAGVRIWSPYRFDLSGLLRNGANEVEVTVYNTLAPYLDDCSPTMGVFPGQRLSGLLGPVTLRAAQPTAMQPAARPRTATPGTAAQPEGS